MDNSGNFRIRRYDAKNLVLETLVPGGLHPITQQPGPDRWEIVGYFGKLSDLLIYLLNQQIAIPGGTLETQINNLLAELQAAEARVVATLKN